MRVGVVDAATGGRNERAELQDAPRRRNQPRTGDPPDVTRVDDVTVLSMVPASPGPCRRGKLRREPLTAPQLR